MTLSVHDLEKHFDELSRALALRVRDELRTAPRPRQEALSWESLKRARAVVHFGGDAVEDCERLYDGLSFPPRVR
jgi:hypothetical protein